jgi:hypothetical protein
VRLQVGEQRHFVHRRQAAQGVERRADRVAGKRHPFAQADRRGLVVDAEDEEAHRSAGLMRGTGPFRGLR